MTKLHRKKPRRGAPGRAGAGWGSRSLNSPNLLPPKRLCKAAYCRRLAERGRS